MKTITVDFSKIAIGAIAKQGEYNKTQIVFVLPQKFAGADYVNAEFVKRDDTTAVVEQLTPSGGTVTVPLTQELTEVDGRLEIQLVAYAVDGTEITEIAKSDVVRGVIRRSLNVLYGGDHPGVIERILAFIHEWAPKFPEMWSKMHWHKNEDILDTITENDIGIHPDWNENDNTSKKFIANRTHWNEDGIVTTEYTVEWTGTAPQGQFQPWDATELGIVLEEGEEYSLEVDGTTFIGTCQKSTATVGGYEQEYFYIGNPHLYDHTQEDNHFPVLLIYDVVHTNPVWTLNVLLTDESLFGSDLTFQLGREETVYHKLSADYLPAGLMDAIQHEHTHENKSLLDKLNETEVGTGNYVFGVQRGNEITYAGFYDIKEIPLPSDPSMPVNWSGNPWANVVYRIGTSEQPAANITIFGLVNMSDDQNNEFVIDFYSGSTPTTLTLPASVEWADELTVEPNKHYQISIVNNIALWCAVDVEAVSS